MPHLKPMHHIMSIEPLIIDGHNKRCTLKSLLYYTNTFSPLKRGQHIYKGQNYWSQICPIFGGSTVLHYCMSLYTIPLPNTLLLAPHHTPQPSPGVRKLSGRGSFTNRSSQPKLNPKGARSKARTGSTSDYSKADFMKPPQGGG